MIVQCFLCDGKGEIDPYSFIAKRIRNRPLTTYMCQACNERITAKAQERLLRKSKQNT